MKNKYFTWIFVLLILVPFSFGIYCETGSCCSNNLVLSARQLSTSFSCDKHDNDLLRTVISCNGISPDSLSTTTTYIACNSTQYCDADSVSCIDGSKPFDDAWGFEYLSGDDQNIFKASLETWKQSADGTDLALYFSWGFIPLLLAIMTGIRFKKTLPAGFVLLISTGALMAFDALPADYSTTVVYYVIALLITISLTGFYGNK